MVKANHLDSPQSGFEIVSIDNGCSSSTLGATASGTTPAIHHRLHQHTRNISSSTSSQASSTTSTNLIADWASSSSSRGLSIDNLEEPTTQLKWGTQDEDLIHRNLSDHLSSSEDFEEDDERIKLLCGDDPDDWPQVDTGQKKERHQATILSPAIVGSNNRRRRILPKPSKIIQKVRRKFNWPLMLILAVILIVTLSLSQLNDYQYGSAAGILGWSPNTTRDTAVYLRPHEHTALLEPRIMDRDKRYLLVVVVCSAVDNFSTRQTIRQTWANGSEFNYAKFFNRMHSNAGSYRSGNDHLETTHHEQLTERADGLEGHLREPDRLDSQVIFLVGRTLQTNATQEASILEESSTYGDLIQEDFVDTYNNLTIKSVMLLKWIARFNDDADRVKYVMKCDDDTFLNVPNLVHVLKGGTVPVYKDTFKLYSDDMLRRTDWLDSVSLMGYLFHSARPIRDVTSKWYAPRFMYRRKVFPNYLSGSGYVMEATKTVKALYKAALRTPIFHLEDVYVTGLCASRRYETRPFHNPLFSFHRLKRLPCSMRGMITQHPMTAKDIRQEYERLTNGTSGGECEEPPRETIERILSQKSAAGRGQGKEFMLMACMLIIMLWT